MKRKILGLFAMMLVVPVALVMVACNRDKDNADDYMTLAQFRAALANAVDSHGGDSAKPFVARTSSNAASTTDINMMIIMQDGTGSTARMTFVGDKIVTEMINKEGESHIASVISGDRMFEFSEYEKSWVEYKDFKKEDSIWMIEYLHALVNPDFFELSDSLSTRNQKVYNVLEDKKSEMNFGNSNTIVNDAQILVTAKNVFRFTMVLGAANTSETQTVVFQFIYGGQQIVIPGEVQTLLA